MKEYKLSRIGEFHLNHNEDAILIKELGNDNLLLAVMDGCSMGTESHFASTLISKILKKIAIEFSYKAFVKRTNRTTKEYLDEVLFSLFKELREIKNLLLLETEEILSTLILGILNIKKNNAEIIVVGDGLICYNGKYIEFEQDNKPDYLGYHLNTDFEIWLQKQTQRLSFTKVKDLSILTDGIFTFKNFDTKNYAQISEKEILNLFLIDNKWKESEKMLFKKLTIIDKQFGLRPSDDISILRIILE